MTKLTYAKRQDLPKGDFVFPKPGGTRLKMPFTLAMRWPAPAENLNTPPSQQPLNGSSRRLMSRSSGTKEQGIGDILAGEAVCPRDPLLVQVGASRVQLGRDSCVPFLLTLRKSLIFQKIFHRCKYECELRIYAELFVL
jgi:hypothetical protein